MDIKTLIQKKGETQKQKMHGMCVDNTYACHNTISSEEHSLRQGVRQKGVTTGDCRGKSRLV